MIFLIIIGVLVAGGFLAGFIWAVKSGQYDDTESPAMRMLFDDAKPVKKELDESDNTEQKNNEPNNNK
ncbi:MAG: cbb3-type cytochrome oxidase assembly protein CcoS [Gammaproteobacteria bacterium]|nr:MAG: cbb3-type cytochrome oxidase assembly protein CcoS [Gammaproteobacteria bacterium]